MDKNAIIDKPTDKSPTNSQPSALQGTHSLKGLSLENLTDAFAFIAEELKKSDPASTEGGGKISELNSPSVCAIQSTANLHQALADHGITPTTKFESGQGQSNTVEMAQILQAFKEHSINNLNSSTPTTELSTTSSPENKVMDVLLTAINKAYFPDKNDTLHSNVIEGGARGNLPNSLNVTPGEIKLGEKSPVEILTTTAGTPTLDNVKTSDTLLSATIEDITSTTPPVIA